MPVTKAIPAAANVSEAYRSISMDKRNIFNGASLTKLPHFDVSLRRTRKLRRRTQHRLSRPSAPVRERPYFFGRSRHGEIAREQRGEGEWRVRQAHGETMCRQQEVLCVRACVWVGV